MRDDEGLERGDFDAEGEDRGGKARDVIANTGTGDVYRALSLGHGRPRRGLEGDGREITVSHIALPEVPLRVDQLVGREDQLNR